MQKKEFIQRMREDLANDVKHNKTSVERIAASFGITDKNTVKEFTELAIVLESRRLSLRDLPVYDRYMSIVELYNKQVTLSHRTSQSMLLQQYSTPAPIGFIAGIFCGMDKEGFYFEPSAGNGLLTIASEAHNFAVNEIDDVRRSNLKEQGFFKVYDQDATKPFPFIKSFDAIITNPPFGKVEPVKLNEFEFSVLDHVMCIRALDTMKDNGNAALIIGGHTAWDDKGRIQAGKNRNFFVYLHKYYNVVDCINIDGHKLYSRQGTAFNTRLILISGRKKVPGGIPPPYSPDRDKTVYSFEELYNRVRKYTDRDLTDKNDFTSAIVSKQGNKETRKHGNEETNLEMEAEALALELELMSLGIGSPFGPVYLQFKGKPKEAIKHLLKVKQGECKDALFRADVGYIDIVWGEHNPKTNNGFGLKHIIEKHAIEIKELGFKVEDFIPIIVQFGEFNIKKSDSKKIIFDGKAFRIIVTKEWFGKKKQFVLSAFDLRPISKKKTLGIVETILTNNFIERILP